jgi:hypothetical protein
MRPRALVLPLLALAFAAAGCGGSASPEEYEATVVETRDRADDALAHITANPEGREELLTRMEEAGVAIEKAAEDLEDTDVPEGLEDKNAQLVTALEQLSVDLTATAEQIRDPSFEGILDGTQGLSFESWDQVNAVFQELRAEGIDVPPLGRH